MALNLVAKSWGEENLKAHDEILLTVSEHHANLVPWQMLAKKTGAKLQFIPLNENFELDLIEAKKLFSQKTKIFSCAHISNVLGVIHPIKELISLAKSYGAVTVIDGAQGVAHLDVNLKDLACDFYAFGAHKMLGPSGVGVLWGRKELLETEIFSSF